MRTEQNNNNKDTFNFLDDWEVDNESKEDTKVEQEEVDITEEKIKQEYSTSKSELKAINGRLMTITKKGYLGALTASTSIKSKSGLYFLKNEKFEKALNLDTPFLSILAKAYWKYFTQNGYSPSDEICINWKTIALELGIDKRIPQGKKEREKARNKYLLNTLDYLSDNLYGKIPRSSAEADVYCVIASSRFDEVTGKLYFVSPYFCELIRSLIQGEIEERNQEGNNAKKNKNTWSSELLHATVAIEKDKPAIEMAIRIIAGVQERGTFPDEQLKQNKNKERPADKSNSVSYTISVENLIRECPKLFESINNCRRTDVKNKVLKRHLKNCYDILEEKSYLPKFYKDFTVEKIYPTSTTLNKCIVIKHNGAMLKSY